MEIKRKFAEERGFCMPISITEELVTLSAPNASAVSNARKISKNGDFISLSQDPEGTLLFGECRGSGKNPYRTSADFLNPEKPVFRCSCPSRQFPCKHALALLYDYLAGKEFQEAAVPEDILQKRQKLAQSEEKKSASSAAPKKVNQAALAKKLKKQAEGLDLAGRFVSDVLRAGLSASASQSLQNYKELAKQLGDYYLPGPQAMVNAFLLEMEALQEHSSGKTDPFWDEPACYTRMLEILTSLSATVKKGRTFLESKLDSQQVLMEDSLLYERLGTVWQLAQLRELGLVRENARLVQFSFEILFDPARQEYADTGWWIDLDTGEISKTVNLRPLKAVKHLKQDDSVFECLQTPCLYFYPGEKNKRIRWEEAATRPLAPEDYAAICSHAARDLSASVKEAKNQIKNPLSEKTMMTLLAFRRIGQSGDRLVMEGASGTVVELRNPDGAEDTINRLHYLPEPSLLENQTMAGEWFYDTSRRQIALRPHSIITKERIIRLLY